MWVIFRNNFWIAILLNGLLFGITLFFFTPAYNTDVDIYFLYTLSGGYGNEPSGLLHYSDAMHPILSIGIARLFGVFPEFNWYSFILLFFHFVSCVTLFGTFLQYFRRSYAIGAFVVFFLFIESRLLLDFNYSGAALMGAMSGSASLLLYFTYCKEKSSVYNRQLFFYLLLMFIAGLIRIHYMALFGCFAVWIALLFLRRNEFLQFFKVHFFLGLILVIFFQGQRYYFQKKIPGWKAEETMRKANIYFSNHPKKETYTKYLGIEKVKQDLISISFLFDKKIFDAKSVKSFAKENTIQNNFYAPDFNFFYWLFMDIRIYLLLFSGLIISLILNKSIRILLRFICISLFFFGTYLGLAIFFKVTEVIYLTVMGSILLTGLFSLNQISLAKFTLRALIFGSLSCSLWMLVRLTKINDSNKQSIAYARNVIKELNEHKNNLFIDAGTFFNFHLSIWDAPQRYPISNFIYNELFFSNSYEEQLVKYGLTDLMKEIPTKENIYLIGEKASFVAEYYEQLFYRPYEAIKIDGYRNFEVYRIRVQEK
jgi:hypothetical protein